MKTVPLVVGIVYVRLVLNVYKYVNTINSPYLQIYPDIGNLTNTSLLYGTSICEDLHVGEGHIVTAHLKETKPGVYRKLPYGDGQVKFSPLIHQLWNQGVRLFVTELWSLMKIIGNMN